jgi:hypothetical protein
MLSYPHKVLMQGMVIVCVCVTTKVKGVLNTQPQSTLPNT